jgi:hypothetical protein
LNSRLITLQQDMDHALKPDGLVKPNGPTERTFTRLVGQGYMKAPATDRTATGTAAGNAAVTAAGREGEVKALEAKRIALIGDPDRSIGEQARDIQKLDAARDEADRAHARARDLERKRAEKAKADAIPPSGLLSQPRPVGSNRSASHGTGLMDAVRELTTALDTRPDLAQSDEAQAGQSPNDMPDAADNGSASAPGPNNPRDERVLSGPCAEFGWAVYEANQALFAVRRDISFAERRIQEIDAEIDSLIEGRVADASDTAKTPDAERDAPWRDSTSSGLIGTLGRVARKAAPVGRVIDGMDWVGRAAHDQAARNVYATQIAKLKAERSRLTSELIDLKDRQEKLDFAFERAVARLNDCRTKHSRDKE